MEQNTSAAAAEQQTANAPSPSKMKLGEILIKEGFVSPAEIDKALQIQASEREQSQMPLGALLVQNGAVTREAVDDALSHPNMRKNIGSLAIEKGLLTKQDLEFVMINKKKGQMIGEALVENGLLTHNDIGDLLKDQINSAKLGETLVDLKLISDHDLRKALQMQKSPRALGEILCDQGLIKPFDLVYVLEKYEKQVGIDSVLLKLGFLDNDKLQTIKRTSSFSGTDLHQTLLQEGVITPEQYQLAVAKQYNLPFDHLDDFAYSDSAKQQLRAIIKQKYAEKNHVLPLSLDGKQLHVAIHDPGNLQYASELIKLFPNYELKFVIVTEQKFEELYEILYSHKLGLLEEQQEDEVADDIDFMEIDLDEEMDESDDSGISYSVKQDIEAEEIVNFIVKYGILNNASDIHLEQDRTGSRLRYRIDGILQDSSVGWLNKKLPDKIGAIISRIKVMSNLDISERRLPQDGVFRINYFDKKTNKKFDLDFRVATCKAIVGENVTIRILDSRKANVGLENLNHSPHILGPFKSLLKSSAGMILVSGPTGSGKSSTLYGALQYVYSPGVKIITAEDPIEYSFPGIMQTQIHPKINLTFARLLRSFLRFDPDIILVGEVRDNETATIAFDAAQTGHLLLSTIHTNDAVSAVSRLADLDVEHGQIASCLLAVLAQRLIRRICPACKKEYVPSEDEWGLLFDVYPSRFTFYKGEGCQACQFSGYKGRTLLSEIFVIDKEIGFAMSKRASDAELRKMAIECGMKTMLDDGLLKLHDTTLSEILRVIPHEMLKEYKERKNIQGDVDGIMTAFSHQRSQASGAVPMIMHKYVISDPQKQSNDIETLYYQYASMNGFGTSNANGNLMLFNEFIASTFTSLCRRHNCSAVEFLLQDNGGKTEISAQPCV